VSAVARAKFQVLSSPRFIRPLVLATVLVACARTNAVIAPNPSEPRFVKVEAFDCAKHDLFPGDPPPTGPIAPGSGIRSWHAGGPYGSNWNVGELRCTVRASAACSRGKVALTLRVGQRVVGERDVPIQSGFALFELLVPERAWEDGLDAASTGPVGKLPFQTASFRALVVLDCEAPTANLREWGYPSVTAEDAFVASFASGE
jgi:hypothetical protein